ncbi:MAG: ribonuclease H-like domain-containing protein [Spirochaetes bacterium]|nr:ribonuclease H-like domain-containing protein [Spirochaetota bacterium]
MDIKSKLKMYTPVKKETGFTGQEVTAEKTAAFLESIGGEKIRTDCGNIWRFEQRTGSNDRYFGIDISLLKKDIQPLLAHLKINTEIDIEDLLFFDLETTSLSTGSGNYPFLSGIGYIDGDDFITEQLFMENYSDEPAILNYLLDFFNNAKAVVAFNGKTFDIPLIKTRYKINRIPGFPVKIPVIDLIIPGRRIFKKVWENCALQTFEKQIIGFERTDDIPGWQIPQAFFEFQKEGILEPIGRIIDHNKYDIISMYVLMFIFSKIFKSVENGNYSEIDRKSLSNIARHLYRVDPDSFLSLAEYLGTEFENDQSIFEKYSITLKRKEEWEKAVAYWKKYPSLFSFCELAKYYEHKDKNLIIALEYAEKGISLIKSGDYMSKNPSAPVFTIDKYNADFEIRKKRLIRKLHSSDIEFRNVN